MILNLYNSLDNTDIILILDYINNLNIYIMKTLNFIENKKLIPIDEPYRIGIESKKEEREINDYYKEEDREINYYYKGSLTFLKKETHKGWTFSIWIMNERVEVFFSRGKYKIVDLEE